MPKLQKICFFEPKSLGRDTFWSNSIWLELFKIAKCTGKMDWRRFFRNSNHFIAYFFFVKIIFVRFMDRDLVLISFHNLGSVHGSSLATRVSSRMLSLSSFRFRDYGLPWCPVSTANSSSPNGNLFSVRLNQVLVLPCVFVAGLSISKRL